jgi:hypothetical protein
VIWCVRALRPPQICFKKIKVADKKGGSLPHSAGVVGQRGVAGRAGEMRATTSSIQPHVFSQQSCRRPTPRCSAPAKRFVARDSEPSARQAERNAKWGCGGDNPHLPSIFVARGSEPSARQAERSGNRECGGGSSHLRLKNPECGLYCTAVAIRESANDRHMFERQRTAPQAKPLQNNNAMRLLSRRRRREASHAGGFLSTAT